VSERDRDAVALLRARKPAGFDWAYAAYRDTLFGFLLRLCGRRSLAEDLFQETWLRLARHGPDLRPDSDLRAWLFTVARNAYHSQLRRQIQEPELSAPLASGGEPELLFSELEQALLALPADDRELLLLVGVEGFSQDELSRLLGIAAPALRQRVTRARTRLAEVLESGPVSSARKRSGHER
jgi:RNA polymerase sigma factor (sigma-70 family)